MKHIIIRFFSLCVIVAGVPCRIAAQEQPVRGRVVSGRQPVAYANVTVHTTDSAFVVGCVSAPDGTFLFRHLPAGDYLLRIACMSYHTVYRLFSHRTASSSLGDIDVKPAVFALNEVVVKAPLIRREADRFVMDVANSPSAVGKDGEELLQQAPGVWITDDQLSLNGMSGTKVFVNERELRLSKEQLVNYLRELKAEDIQQIDIVPQTGADYDANTSSGVIRIRLKRQRQDGMSGNASFRTRTNAWTDRYDASGEIRYHIGRLTTDVGFSGNYCPKARNTIDEANLASNTRYVAASRLDEASQSWKERLGVMYEFDPKRSVGIEAEYIHGKENCTGTSSSQLATGNAERRTVGVRCPDNRKRQLAVVFNYIRLLDEQGSVFKMLGDYSRNRENNRMAGHTSISSGTAENDSLYREHTETDYRTAALTLAWEKRFFSGFTLKVGGKYTFNRMQNRALYEHEETSVWLPTGKYSFDLCYKERIGALYAVAAVKTGRFGMTGGLRAEHTRTDGGGEYVGQNYLSWFPNLNVSYSFDRDGANMAVLQCSRFIARPGFWELNPTRIQVSEYTYQSGNPALRPAYKTQWSVTFIAARKYTLTLMAGNTKDFINQYVSVQPDNPDVSYITQKNFRNVRQYIAVLQLPFKWGDWWSGQNEVTFVRNGERLHDDDPQVFRNIFFYKASSAFRLPGKFYLDVSYRYNGKTVMSNFRAAPFHRVDIRLKKKLFQERLTVAIGMKNLLARTNDLCVTTGSYERSYRMKGPFHSALFECRLNYSFQSGKTFKSRKIESGSEDEKGRMNKGNVD